MKRASIAFVKAFFLAFLFLSFAPNVDKAQVVNLTLPTITGSPGASVLAPVTVDNLTGKNITAWQIIIRYDPNVIVITGMDLAGTIMSGQSITMGTPDTVIGKIRAAWAGSSPLSGAGTLFNLRVRYKNVGTTAITVNETANPNFTLFNTTPPTVVNGSATTSSIPQYTVALSSNPSGSGTTSGGGTFQSGSSVTVSAVANAGYDFVNWTEGSTVVSTSASYTFTLSASRSLVANFTVSRYTVTANVNPAGAGTVTGAGTYNYNTHIILTAAANTGYTFKNWTDNGTIVSTNNIYEFNLQANKTIVANFDPVQYTISATANPSGGGTITGSGTYNYGQSATLAATAASGYTFVNWTEGGNVVTGAGSTYTFTVNSSRTLVANFSNQYTVTTAVNPLTGGVVTGAGTYNPGSTVTLTAVAASGYVFSFWTEGGVVVPGAGSTYTFLINSNRNLVANFSYATYLISLNSNPSGGGTTSGSGIFSYNQSVTVTATSNTGYNFVNWTESGTEVSKDANFTFIISGNRTLTANFALIPALSVSPDYVQVDFSAGTNKFTVANTTEGTMNWTAAVSSSSNWITITSGASGTNSGTINFSYQANSGAARVGTITVTAVGAIASPKTVEVRQSVYVSVEDEKGVIPTKYELFQNYPNPFNPSTKIQFNIPDEDRVVLKIFNLMGQEVATLVNKPLAAGSYTFDFDASKLNSGIYFYKLSTSKYNFVKKMLLIK